MRYASFLVLMFSFAAAVFAQPGDEGTLSVNVVDEKGKSVRGVGIMPAGPGEGRPMFSRIFPTASERGFEELFFPRDAEFSSFIANIRCRGDRWYAIKISATGYETLVHRGELAGCADEITVTLKRNSEPLAETPALFELRGKLTDQTGRALPHRFQILQSRHNFRPKIAADGTWTAKLTAGLYEIDFRPYNCSEHNIKNFRIYDRPRTLNIVADCP